MAYEIPGFDITGKSSGDMSSNQYKLVELSTTNADDGVIIGPSSAGGRVFGIWQGNSTAAEYGKVRVSGVSKAQVSTGSGPIVRGSPLTGSTNGSVTLSTSTAGTQYHVGSALVAHASGSSGVIAMYLDIVPGSNLTT